jgi:hypothetical protein
MTHKHYEPTYKKKKGYPGFVQPCSTPTTQGDDEEQDDDDDDGHTNSFVHYPIGLPSLKLTIKKNEFASPEGFTVERLELCSPGCDAASLRNWFLMFLKPPRIWRHYVPPKLREPLQQWRGVIPQERSPQMVYHLYYYYYYYYSWNSVVGIATHYRLDGPEIESLWGLHFSHPSRPTWCPPSLL